ncbi:MAG: hypothetical protein ACOC6R_01475 [Chloroflexota bacterium]
MKRVPQPNVLFVNIGWAPIYNGEHLILGNHDDIKQQSGDPSSLGEGKAFLLDSTGRVKCVVGMGRVRPDSSIDVVFVAHNPSTHHHEIVGIYFEPSFSYAPWRSSKGREEIWADASTREFRKLLGSQRASIVWPLGRSMRRWVRRSGTVRYSELFDQYSGLI